ncbi:MAG: prevent-host-death protein [Tannerella sp.]|jgi:hypothetical protein|nr:prevent-host-death protein [Tannerella sp.]
MLVVSTREFRQNQKSYLDRIDAGAQVFIQRGKNRCYAVSAVKEDDTLMTEEEFLLKTDNDAAMYGYLLKQDPAGKEYLTEQESKDFESWLGV